MNRGFYYACNGMIMNQRKLDCIGNKLQRWENILQGVFQ